MKNIFFKLLIASLFMTAIPSFSQIAVTENKNHESMLASNDPNLAKNKKLVYDFWREVIEAGNMNLAGKYLTESYIQHNPNIATGRQAFVDFFSKFTSPQPIKNRISMPLVSITAERDIVVLSFVEEQKDPRDSSKTYTTTSFDMFRIENGKIAEHWDGMQKS
jgi:predicted SnoaL-like aldol condensation-catalyzing enzyme